MIQGEDEGQARTLLVRYIEEQTAANGGIDALAVAWGYRSAEDLAGHRIVHTVDELRLSLFTSTP